MSVGSNPPLPQFGRALALGARCRRFKSYHPDLVTYQHIFLIMQIFLDTADYREIKDRYETGLVAGITTNPTLVRKSGVDYFDFIRTLSQDFTFESISAEVDGNTADEMMENAQQYIAIGPEVTIKLPSD